MSSGCEAMASLAMRADSAALAPAVAVTCSARAMERNSLQRIVESSEGMAVVVEQVCSCFPKLRGRRAPIGHHFFDEFFLTAAAAPRCAVARGYRRPRAP